MVVERYFLPRSNKGKALYMTRWRPINIRQTCLTLWTTLCLLNAPTDLRAQRTTLRDSAGITIVTNDESNPTRIPIWRVDPEPMLVIGQLDGPEEYLFQAVQAGMLLSDGTTVVLNSLNGLFEIRYFDSAGIHLTTVGRWGEGPWEFHFVRGVHPLPGDSVLVLGLDHRFALFGPAGERVREGRLALAPSGRGIWSALMDSEHLALVQSLGLPRPGQGQQRSQRLFRIHDLARGTTDTIARLGDLIEYSEIAGGGVHYNFMYPFSPRSHHAAGGGRVWLGQSDVPEIRGFGPDGRISTIIRLKREPREITRADRNRFREEESAKAGSLEAERRFNGALRRMGYPNAMPLFGHFKVDRLGNLWVQRYLTEWAEGDQHWDIYNQQGVWTASVRVPAAVLPKCDPIHLCNDLLEIGGRYILVEQKGPFDVPLVVRYRLIKDPEG